MDLFGMGPMELLVVLFLAFLLLGPSKLGDVAKGLGRAMREVRRNVSEMTRAIEGDEPPAKAGPEQQGQDKLASVVKDLGKTVREVRRSVTDLTRAIEEDGLPKPTGQERPKALDTERKPPEEKP